MVKDRFVTGLNENYVHVQEKLSNMTQLTFEKAVEIAVSMTMVKENAKKFRSPGGSAVNHEVNAMSANRVGVVVEIIRLTLVNSSSLFLVWQNRSHCSLESV